MEIIKFKLALLDFKQVGLGSPDRFTHYILWVNYKNNKQTTTTTTTTAISNFEAANIQHHL